MATVYCAFLLRCWRLAGGQQRLEVQQISSGERIVVTSAAAALAWVTARTDDTAAVPATRAEGGATVPGALGDGDPDA